MKMIQSDIPTMVKGLSVQNKVLAALWKLAKGDPLSAMKQIQSMSETEIGVMHPREKDFWAQNGVRRALRKTAIKGKIPKPTSIAGLAMFLQVTRCKQIYMPVEKVVYSGDFIGGQGVSA